jgi:hypothetical protein
LILAWYNRRSSSNYSKKIINKSLNLNQPIKNKNESQANLINSVNQNFNQNLNRKTNLNVNSPFQSKSKIKKDLEKMARLFSEHFGSFSNNTNFANILNLKVYMSSRMQKWADRFVAQGRKNAANRSSKIYYGITTYALASHLNKFDEQKGEAEFLVSTQRREYLGSPNNSRTFKEDIIIKFVKEKDVWKVDGAFWQGH